jgi:hypothetical protein
MFSFAPEKNKGWTENSTRRKAASINLADMNEIWQSLLLIIWGYKAVATNEEKSFVIN